jgi:MFS family permease
MYGIVWAACVSGNQMQKFATMLGFTDFDFGLMASIPFLASFLQLNAAILIERTGLKKYQFIYFGAIHRLLWLGVAAVPLVFRPGRGAVWCVLIILTLSWMMNALSAPAWLTWMGDLIPRRIRGRYFAARARLTDPIMIVVVLVTSVLLDRFATPGAPDTMAAQSHLMYAICVLFAVSALFGATDILTFRRIREVMPPVDLKRRPQVITRLVAPKRWTLTSTVGFFIRHFTSAVRELLLDPLKDRVFRNYIGFGATITFSVTMSAWFFWKNASENLRFSTLGTNTLFLVIGPIVGILTYRMWGRLIDRWGRRPVLIVATIGTATTIIPWLLASPQTPSPDFAVHALNWVAGGVGSLLGQGGWTWITGEYSLGAYLLASLACVIGGMTWGGVNLAQTGVVLGFSDGQGRSKYIAASSVLISVGGVLGGVVGGSVAQLLGGMQRHPITLGGGAILWNNWHVTIMLTLVIRLISLAWLARMPDPSAAKVRDLVRQMGTNAFNAVATRLFYPLTVFGWGKWGERARTARAKSPMRNGRAGRPPRRK